MDDVPWLYVAMIFLAFVSWVVGRIKEAMEYRRERRAERAAAERARRTAEPVSPYTRTPETKGPQKDKSFREIYQELERRYLDPSGESAGWEEAEEPEPSRQTPPPLPSQSKSADNRKPEKREAKAVSPFPQTAPKPIEVAPPLKVYGAKSSSKRNLGPFLANSLRDPRRLKTALILNEILGPPKSMRRGPNV